LRDAHLAPIVKTKVLRVTATRDPTAGRGAAFECVRQWLEEQSRKVLPKSPIGQHYIFLGEIFFLCSSPEYQRIPLEFLLFRLLPISLETDGSVSRP
jgi:hypothetical protein